METNLIPNAGLLPAPMLVQRIDPGELFDERLQLAKHGASRGRKALTVIGSMLAGATASMTPWCSAPALQGRCSTSG